MIGETLTDKGLSNMSSRRKSRTKIVNYKRHRKDYHINIGSVFLVILFLYFTIQSIIYITINVTFCNFVILLVRLISSVSGTIGRFFSGKNARGSFYKEVLR